MVAALTKDLLGAIGMKRRPSYPDRRLQSIKPVLTYSEVVGERLPPRAILVRAAQWDWRMGLVKLATLAAVLANSDGRAEGATARSWTNDLLARSLDSSDPLERRVAEGVLGRQEPIGHEAAVHFLQAVVLRYGADSGRVPSDGEVGLLLLAANDYFNEWHEQDDGVAPLDAGVANVARSMLHDRKPDAVAHCLRLPALLNLDLPHGLGGFSNPREWQTLLTTAFDGEMSDFLELQALPLVLMSNDWGRGEPPRPPTFIAEEWAKETPHAQGLSRFVKSIATSRDDLRSRLLLRADGLPLGPSPFWRSPFIELGPGQFVCVSPGVLREQVRNAMWGRLLAASEVVQGASGKTRWLSTFGYRFEYWCRQTAIKVGEGQRLGKQLRLAERAGTAEEIEDVVLLEKGKVALFSAKSRMMREDLLKGATSVAKTMAWLNGFLFGAASGAQRAGAIRLLDAKVRRIRNGLYSAIGIAADVEIYPLLLTFDEVGLDTPPGYRWLSQRLRDENLLLGTRPLTVLSAESYEHFLALCLRRNAFEVLTYKTNEQWRECRFDDLFFQLSGKRGPQGRLPGATEEFDDLARRVVRRLFRGEA